jgi:hypothetical protein
MNDAQLQNILLTQQAAVVHFSHHANMRSMVTFPGDLQQAIAKKDIWPLSCCVVWPGHGMALPGDIGVMFCPTVSSVLSVCDQDAGSMVAHDGSELSAGEPLSDESLERTFCPTGAYNEWRVKGAKVTGIYVRDTNFLTAKKEQHMAAGSEQIVTIGVSSIDLSEVFEAFPSLRIFTHDFSALIEVRQ